MLHIYVVMFANRMPSAKTLARMITKNAAYQLKRFKEGEQKMKVLSVLLLIGVYIMGAYDGDSTAAVVLTMLFIPILFDGKKVKK
jgi:hypothetical protein